MKKLLQVLCVLLFIGLSHTGFAQLSMGGGLAFNSDIEDIGLSAKVNYKFSDEKYTASPSFTYYFAGNDLTFSIVNLNGHYNLIKIGDNTTIYPLGGLAIFRSKNDNVLIGDGTSTNIGLNIGGGLEFPVSSLLLYVEGKYVKVSGGTGLVINAGIMYPF